MLKKVRIERGAKSNKLLRISYQNADTDRHFEWDKVIEDQKQMKAIDSVCGSCVYAGTYGQRAIYVGYIEYDDILAALAG